MKDLIKECIFQNTGNDKKLINELNRIIYEGGETIYQTVLYVMTDLEMRPDEAKKCWNEIIAHYESMVEALGLGADVSAALQEFPNKQWDQVVPTDPVIYRLYEIVGVYGETIKEIIHEKFGDGIMSAIDYSMHIDKEENPAGDRVVITLNGKFLPYKSW